ncbi:MAG: family 10 glycosylhydrolase [Firmicutes bacterium]|nr:family 10 glycosylhydrolase [Bacillota bacterium]
MKKNYKKLIAAVFALVMGFTFYSNAFSLLSASASGFSVGITIDGVTFGSSITIDQWDPIEFSDHTTGASTSTDVRERIITIGANDTVMYTPNWIFNTSRRFGAHLTEITAEFTEESNRFRIIAIVENPDLTTQQIIPAGGFAISIPTQDVPSNWTVGAIIGVQNRPATVSFPRVVVDVTHSDNANVGNRVAVGQCVSFAEPAEGAFSRTHNIRDDATSAINRDRRERGVHYYDYMWRPTTSSNMWGTEIIFTVNPTTYQFEVMRFRPFGYGGQQGIPIPYNSFALSAFGRNIRGFLEEDTRFSMGDKVELVGIDFLRGIVATNTFENRITFVNPTNASPAPSGNTLLNANQLADREEPGSVFSDGTTAFFPGFRGPGDLIAFTEQWRPFSSSTSFPGLPLTNIWGWEVAISSEGVVVESAQNITVFPAGGFVLSGNGDSASWLASNVSMGATVVRDNRTLTVTTTLASYLAAINAEREQALVTLADRQANMFDIDYDRAHAIANENDGELTDLIGRIQTIIDLNPQYGESGYFRAMIDFNNYLQRSQVLVEELRALMFESRIVDSRAVWHRPNMLRTEESLDGIRATLQKFKDNNINLIFVETKRNGFVKFDPAGTPLEGVFPMHPTVDFCYAPYPDYFTAFTSEAYKLGIEVHAWFHIFYVGQRGSPSEVWLNNPTWRSYLSNGEIAAPLGTSDFDYLWIDPSQPGYHEVLFDLTREVARRAPTIRGINIDYIRYNVSRRTLHTQTNSTTNYDTGYSVHSITKFARDMGYTDHINVNSTNFAQLRAQINSLFDPAAVGNALAERAFTDWKQWRADQISGFVQQLSEVIKELPGNLMLSTAIFPGNEGFLGFRHDRMQHWRRWAESGWLCMTTPMAYSPNAAIVGSQIASMVSSVRGLTFNYAGLAPSYQGLPDFSNIDQISAALAGQSLGYVIFASQNILFQDHVERLLRASFNRREAYLPHEAPDIIIRAILQDSLRKADDLYIPGNAMTQAQRAALEARYEAIMEMNTGSAFHVYATMNAVVALRNIIAQNVNPYAAAPANHRIRDDLDLLISVLDIHVSRLMIAAGDWIPVETRTRPTPLEFSVVGTLFAREFSLATSYEVGRPITINMADLFGFENDPNFSFADVNITADRIGLSGGVFTWTPTVEGEVTLRFTASIGTQSETVDLTLNIVRATTQVYDPSSCGCGGSSVSTVAWLLLIASAAFAVILVKRK